MCWEISVITKWRVWRVLFGGGERLFKILMICLGGWIPSGEELGSGVAASLGIARCGPAQTQIANKALPKKILAMPQGGLTGVIAMGGESLH